MWCRALKTPAVKYMMVGQEKKAVEEYNCPVVSVLSDGAFGRRRHRGRAFSSCVVQEEVDIRTFKAAVRQITHINASK